MVSIILYHIIIICNPREYYFLQKITGVIEQKIGSIQLVRSRPASWCHNSKYVEICHLTIDKYIIWHCCFDNSIPIQAHCDLAPLSNAQMERIFHHSEAGNIDEILHILYAPQVLFTPPWKAHSGKHKEIHCVHGVPRSVLFENTQNSRSSPCGTAAGLTHKVYKMTS
jgi:hypothetical protein